jgi:sugar phosphate isomerase/epimerase
MPYDELSSRAGPPIGLGALVNGRGDPSGAARRLLALGFERFELEFWESLGDADLAAIADSFSSLRAGGAAVSALGVYGNTLDPAGNTLASVKALIEAAKGLGSPIVSCFAGRCPGKSVPDSIETWKRVFGGLADRASALGVTIALENCRLGDTWRTGKWNIAINPDAWELLFDALPGAPIALEWEPAHQVLALADPLVQLRAWVSRVAHVHGKDGRLDRRALSLKGYFAAVKIGQECLPGEGDTDWDHIFVTLAEAGYKGSVDLELPAEGRSEDQNWSQAEEARLVASLAHLKSARDRACA